jgi:hypothetical protein
MKRSRPILGAPMLTVALACSCGGTVVSSASGGGGGASSATSTSFGNTGGSSSSGAVYSAFNLVTNLPRYVVFKREPALDRCVQLMVSMTAGPGIGIQTTMGWSVDQALITPHASDCALDASGYPIVTMMSVTASGATGTLVQQPAGFQPCTVSVHASLMFPSGSWAPPSDALDVDGLKIQGPGGC